MLLRKTRENTGKSHFLKYKKFLFFRFCSSLLKYTKNSFKKTYSYKFFNLRTRKLYFANIRNFFELSYWNARSFFKKFHFQKYKKCFFWEITGHCLISRLESPISPNKRKNNFFWENIRNSFRADIFYFSRLGWKVV